MTARRKMLPMELRKPKVATVVLEVSSKSGAPIRARDKLRLRKAMRHLQERQLMHGMPEVYCVNDLLYRA